MGNDKEILDQCINDCLRDQLNVNYAQIWREGKLTAEYKRVPVKTRLHMWSVSKGFTSCAVGIAREEGLLRLDERVQDVFPEYTFANPGKYAEEVTLEHLLTMTAGMEQPLFRGDSPERFTTSDWVQYYFDNACFSKVPGNVYCGYGYGYQFIMNPEPGAFRSEGNFGQFCIVYPEKEVVIAFMSFESRFPEIGNHIWKTIVPNI